VKNCITVFTPARRRFKVRAMSPEDRVPEPIPDRPAEATGEISSLPPE